ncbi:hypothetical protein D3C87_1370190 [compost metagenome]
MQLNEADIPGGIVIRLRKAITRLRRCIRHQNGVDREIEAAIAACDLTHDGIVEEGHIAADNRQNRYRNIPRGDALHLGDADMGRVSSPARKSLETVRRACGQHFGGIIFYVVGACSSIEYTRIKKWRVFGDCLLSCFFDLFFAFWIISVAHLMWIPPKITL